jgi:pyruvate dehydrogenase E2 component (dihydrolipoamide acetyltransferase)
VATPITMPQLGETVVEGTITKWLKKEGERVERDEPLFEISTDKVDTEVPSPMAGTIKEIKVPEGETVEVGTELAVIEEGDGQAAAPAKEDESKPAEEAAPAQEAPAEEAPAAKTEEPKPEPEPEPPAAAEPAAQQEEGAEAPAAEPAAKEEAPAAEAGGEEGNGQVQAAGASRSHILSPLVRRLADEHGIDLSQVQGTGTGGRITKSDVMAFVEGKGQPAQAPAAAAAPQAPAQAPAAAAPQAPAPAEAPAAAPERAPAAAPAARAPAPAGAGEEAVPLSRMRQAIAKNMVASLQTTARAWNLVEVNMDSVMRVREAAKEAFKQREGMSLTVTPFVARAVCEALLAFPDVNGEIRDDQLILKRYVNLGIAVALDEGLIVPVVKGADTMNIVGLARAIKDVADRARNKKLTPDDVHGGTFTITNPGPFGSIMSVPVINPPQCGILALDAVEKRPVVIDDALAIRPMVYISMSWDHRIIDGATAAKFLARIKQNLETWDFGPEVGLPAKGA